MTRSFLVGWITCLLGAVVGCGDNRMFIDTPTGPQCSDGEDNDGDGQIDYPADLGCDNENDETEDGLEKPQCSDGRDNDGDGKTDYPDDPGCPLPELDGEEDDCPSGPGCPQCANGIDDDNNGMMDFPDDPGCTSAGDANEFIDNPVACGAGLMIKMLSVLGTDMGMLDATASTSMITTTCGGGAGAPAVAYVFHLTEPKVMVARTDLPGTNVDTVLDLRSADCQNPSAHIACNDDAGTSSGSSITESLAAGTYYLIVQGHGLSDSGPYSLEVNFFAGEGETCGTQAECGPGLVCRVPANGTDMICTQPVCNDGLDDDGDTKIDYPLDPGCTSATDDTEDDDCPSGPNCPDCSNEVDDDLDGDTDYPADTNCVSAAHTSESCDQAEPIIVATTPQTMGTTAGATNDFFPPQGDFNNHLCSTTSTHTAPDQAIQIDIPAVSTLDLDLTGLTPFWDSAHVLLDASCGGTPIECFDNPNMPLTNLAAGTYYLIVDGYSTGSGPFILNISGTIVDGESCESDLAQSGALTCGSGFACKGAVGSRTCQPAECNDGIDNNGQAGMDYPADPGCASASDDDEDTVCPGPSCPVCSDLIDNDMDGFTDYLSDPSCIAASGTTESCTETEPILIATTPQTSSTTAGATNDFMPPPGNFNGHLCSTSLTHTAPDRMIELELPGMTSLSLNLDPVSYDSAHVLLNASCTGTPIECFDNASMSVGSLAAGTYYLVVDGYSSGSGTFTLNVSGTIADGESCESPLAQSGAIVCASTVCDGPVGSRICVPPQCNDGIDNNGAGGTDYPNDPGCASPTDDSEDNVTCPGPACPACANGVDDDTDTLIDYPSDLQCPAASFVLENFCPIEPNVLGMITDPVTLGTMASPAADNYDQSCQSNTTNDVAYLLQLPVAVASLTIDTEGSAVADTVLSLRDAQCGTEIDCDDDGGSSSFYSLITASNVAAGDYAIQVDSYGGTSNNGPFTLNVRGTVAAGTACTSPLFGSGVLVCPASTSCTGGTCQ